MWSPVEKTALAEAEIEYHDHTSDTIWVRFPVPRRAAPGRAVVIWTTTPWTMPGNRAIACGTAIEYALLHVDGIDGGQRARGRASGCSSPSRAPRSPARPPVSPRTTSSACSRAPISSARSPRIRCAATATISTCRCLLADFVDTEQGSGFVHIAPGHGEDDFALGRAHGIAVPDTVGADGTFNAWVPGSPALHVYKAADAGRGGARCGRRAARARQARAFLSAFLALQGAADLPRDPAMVHPPGWAGGDPRASALAAIDTAALRPRAGPQPHPQHGRARPDWCISRQRAWGVPIAVFVDRAAASRCATRRWSRASSRRSGRRGRMPGMPSPPSRFLGHDRNPDEYEQVRDIVDVWFESGSTHAFVLEARGMPWPADLYLEGSDQHRGWFQSSLLEAVGTRGRAPFRAVLTHGFVLDEQGRKMAKSLGNVVAPQRGHGAVRRRHPAALGDDVATPPRICASAPKSSSSRPSCIAACATRCAGCSAASPASPRPSACPRPRCRSWSAGCCTGSRSSMQQLRGAVASHDWTGVYPAIHAFCAADLSAFYFDVRKDALYCDRPDSLRRRAARTMLDHLHRCLATWLAPVLCFTAEEAWRARFGEDASACICETFPDVPAAWRDAALAQKWERIRDHPARRHHRDRGDAQAGRLGASLQAAVTLHSARGAPRLLLGGGMGGGADRLARCSSAPSGGGVAARSASPPGAQMRPLLARAAGGRTAARRIPRSACAAPMRSRAGWCAGRRRNDRPAGRSAPLRPRARGPGRWGNDGRRCYRRPSGRRSHNADRARAVPHLPRPSPPRGAERVAPIEGSA